MKSRVLVSFGVTIALAACSAEPDAASDAEEPDASLHNGHQMMEVSEEEARDKHEAADLLVARFDAPACQKVDLLGTVRRTSPDGGERLLRAYGATSECAAALDASVKTLEFNEVEPNIFAGAAPDGSADRVFIEVAEEGSGAIVEWEVIRQ
ncbi:MAG: hypothetical protein AAGH57_07385 [Pseudomonadota bacterium]